MEKTKLLVIGGFLGAGKTTAILRLAVMLRERGRKVGIVTNDQGSNLVDTRFLAEHGFPVMEVTGGCFCCNFDQLSQKLSEMTGQEYPDYILAEPVGSCTDLVSTIMKPLRNGYAGRFALAPLSIVCDPLRIRRFLDEKPGGFSNEINYLFRKQLEEAELIILNKCDRLGGEDIRALIEGLGARFPGIEILPASAKTGLGLDAWASRLLAEENKSAESLSIQYDTYAAAEASLGWFNLSAEIAAPDGEVFDANAFADSLARGIRDRLCENQNELAHLKLYMVASSDYCKLSCVSVREDISEDKRMTVRPSACTLIINIRAFSSPDFLKTAVHEHLCALCGPAGLTVSEPATESFRPAYPRPKYRL